MSNPLAPARTGLGRRDLFKVAGLAALGTAAVAGTAAPAAAAVATPKWPGHKPGKIYLGLAVAGDPSQELQSVGSIGLFREYFKWTSAGELREVQQQQAAGRLPWVSFTPPATTSNIWAAVASGRYDADLRAKARGYAQLTKPAILSFSHEPQTKNYGTPGDWAAAWCRVHDVMKSETGLKNIVSVPILGDWVFNPSNNRDDPAAYLTPAVLSRAHFLGIDLYQNQSGDDYAARLPRILSFLDSRGHSDMMIGLGETGATNKYGNPSGAAWWGRSWSWAAANTGRVGAISYFDSLASNNSGNNWLLTESPDKLSAFRASVSSATASRSRRRRSPARPAATRGRAGGSRRARSARSGSRGRSS